MLDCSVDAAFVCVDSRKGGEASGSFALTKKKIRLCEEIDLCNSQSSLLMICFDGVFVQKNTTLYYRKGKARHNAMSNAIYDDQSSNEFKKCNSSNISNTYPPPKIAESLTKRENEHPN